MRGSPDYNSIRLVELCLSMFIDLYTHRSWDKLCLLEKLYGRKLIVLSFPFFTVQMDRAETLYLVRSLTLTLAIITEFGLFGFLFSSPFCTFCRRPSISLPSSLVTNSFKHYMFFVFFTTSSMSIVFIVYTRSKCLNFLISVLLCSFLLFWEEIMVMLFFLSFLHAIALFAVFVREAIDIHLVWQ